MRKRKLSSEKIGPDHPLWNSGVSEIFTQVLVWQHPPAGFDGDKELLSQFYGPFAKLEAANYMASHKQRS